LADRYAVVRELGAGGMATVYLATDLKHGREVAIKVLRPELTASLGTERFHREIEIAARLHHPHILGLLDSGDAGGLLYYVMPYVEGTSLRERLERSGELPVPEAVRILRDVVDALAYAHAKGVTHRDVKPENVMLTGRHALVTDFGVAKAVSAATASPNVTTAGVALGTPAYMSPEQATADPQADHRSDLYSVGVMAYELVSGAPPFAGGSAQTILAKHVTEAPAPITERRAGIPAGLAALVMRALEKRPADRFQSADEMLGLLEALVTSSGGTTPVDTRSVRAVPGGRRPVRTVGIVATVAVASLAIWLGISSRGAGSGRAATAGGPPSVGVLPFTELNAPAGQEYFADGLTEEVIGALSRMPSLRVPGRASSMHFKGSQSSIRAMAESLNVRSILTASIQRSGDRVRIRADLVNAEDGFQLWSATYDESVENLFAVYDRVAQSIAGALKVRLVATGGAAVEGFGTVRQATNARAYNDYLIGRYQLNRRTPAAVDSARIFFERALAADSTYAPAWSGLADAFTLSTPAQYGVTGASAQAALDRALAAARRAVALAPSSGEARTSLALAHDQRWEWRESAPEWERALELDPNYAPLRHFYGAHLVALGRLDQALVQFARAEELDPLYWISGVWTGMTLWAAGRHEPAVRKFDDLVARHPGVARIHAEAGLMAMRRGDFDRAGTEYGLLFELSGNSGRAQWVREGLARAATRGAVAAELARGNAAGLQAGGAVLGGPRGVEMVMAAGDRALALVLLDGLSMRPGESGPASLRVSITHPELRRTPTWREHFRAMGVEP
jgi:serine/threonine-protein kinase